MQLFLFPLQHMKRPALHIKQVGVLRIAFRARKVFGTFEKRALKNLGLNGTRTQTSALLVQCSTRLAIWPIAKFITLKLFSSAVQREFIDLIAYVHYLRAHQDSSLIFKCSDNTILEMEIRRSWNVRRRIKCCKGRSYSHLTRVMQTPAAPTTSC